MQSSSSVRDNAEVVFIDTRGLGAGEIVGVLVILSLLLVFPGFVELVSTMVEFILFSSVELFDPPDVGVDDGVDDGVDVGVDDGVDVVALVALLVVVTSVSLLLSSNIVGVIDGSRDTVGDSVGSTSGKSVGVPVSLASSPMQVVTYTARSRSCQIRRGGSIVGDMVAKEGAGRGQRVPGLLWYD